MTGFKIGLYRHLREEIRDPADLDRVRRTADAADEAALRAGVASYFPAVAAAGRLLSASACFFTNTPDGHFLVDRHPRHPQASHRLSTFNRLWASYRVQSLHPQVRV